MNEIGNKSVKILGSGVAGLTAAITLSKGGLDVEVFEKGSHAGGRFKRDFQSLRNFGINTLDPIIEFEKYGIPLKPYKKLMKVIRYSRSHYFEVTSNNKPLYYLVLRGKDEKSIDSQLEGIATRQGVHINFNLTLADNQVDIIASGPPRADGHAYGEIYEDSNIDDRGYVFLDSRYSPNGYFYALPGEKKGEVELINGIRDPKVRGQTIKFLYNRMIQKNNILKGLLEGATKKSVQSGMGCFTLLEKPYQNNRYFIGEAAGLQDVTAGFGIRYAIISGYLSAQSILTGEDYNRLITKAFKSQLEFEKKRNERNKKLTNDEIDKFFQLAIDKFGHEFTTEEYESLRGYI
jgi:flavin-dependent dehydrogenase